MWWWYVGVGHAWDSDLEVLNLIMHSLCLQAL